MTDELGAPLGRKRRKRGASGRGLDPSQWPWARMGLGGLVLAGAGIIAWIALVDDPTGGRSIERVATGQYL